MKHTKSLSLLALSFIFAGLASCTPISSSSSPISSVPASSESGTSSEASSSKTEESYAVSVSTSDADVAVTLDKSEAKAGEQVTITTEKVTGKKQIKTLLANGVELEANNVGTYAFLMPNSPVEITFETEANVLACNFYDYNGTLLESTTVEYGGTAVYSAATPTGNTSNTTATYTFSGWDKSLENITEDTDFYALYEIDSVYDYVYEIVSVEDSETGVSESYAYLSAYIGDSATEITIPEKYGDYTVAGISTGAFAAATAVKIVNVPSSITTIEDSAFATNTSIEQIKGMTGVKTIGVQAFRNCTALTSVDLPEGIESIGNYAFWSSGVTKVSLPDTITNSPTYLFRECLSLTEVRLPDTWTTLPNATFYDAANVTTFNWPSALTTIGNNVFQGANSITTLNVPEGVTSAGYYAFSQMDSLTSVTLPSTLTTVQQYLFYADPLLESVTLPEGITELKFDFFRNCTSLKSVSIPSTCVKFGNNIFVGCTSLESVTLPEGTTSIGTSMFLGCTSLTSAPLPSSITSIPNYTYYGCTNFSYEISSSITKIGMASFHGIKSLTVSSDNTAFKIEDNALLSADGKTYYDYLATESAAVTIPDGVTTIDGYAFANRTVTSLTFPSTLTKINNYAFSGILGIESITIPETVTSLGYAFYGYDADNKTAISSSIKEIKVKAAVSTVSTLIRYNTTVETVYLLNEKIATISSSCFASASGLKTVYIPKSVTTIGYGVFDSVEQHIDIMYEGNEEDFFLISNSDTFTNYSVTYDVDFSQF